MRIAGLGAICLSLVPSLAFADDVTMALPGATVPVGPAGTSVLAVTRTQVGRERYAVIRSRASDQPSRCAVAPERVLDRRGEVPARGRGAGPERRGAGRRHPVEDRIRGDRDVARGAGREHADALGQRRAC